MRIASVLENQNIEKRIAITPEVAKKYINNGFKVTINKSYGEHLGFLIMNIRKLVYQFLMMKKR